MSSLRHTPPQFGASTSLQRLRRARRSVAAVFLVHAGIAGCLAPRIPAIKADLGLGDGSLGAALTGFAAGLFAGTRIAAWLIDRFGSRMVVRVALPVYAAALVGPALADDLLGLTLALAAFGLASGLIDVAMNAQAVVIERAYERPILSSLHGVWSVGLLAAAGIASAAAALGASVLLHFSVAAAVLLVAGLVAPFGLLAKGQEHVHENGERLVRGREWRLTVAALGAIGFCAFLGEGAAADWTGVYLQEDMGTGGGIAALGFTVFALGMVVGRFAGDRLAARFGPVALVRAGGFLAAAGLGFAVAVMEPGAALGGFALLGLGFSTVVPVTFSAAGNVGVGSSALGWVVTVSYVGTVAGPAMIGFISHAVGLRIALVLPVALAAVAALLAPFVRTAAGRPPPTREMAL
jgi:MFS family permease